MAQYIMKNPGIRKIAMASKLAKASQGMKKKAGFWDAFDWTAPYANEVGSEMLEPLFKHKRVEPGAKAVSRNGDILSRKQLDKITGADKLRIENDKLKKDVETERRRANTEKSKRVLNTAMSGQKNPQGKISDISYGGIGDFLGSVGTGLSEFAGNHPIATTAIGSALAAIVVDRIINSRRRRQKYAGASIKTAGIEDIKSRLKSIFDAHMQNALDYTDKFDKNYQENFKQPGSLVSRVSKTGKQYLKDLKHYFKKDVHDINDAAMGRNVSARSVSEIIRSAYDRVLNMRFVQDIMQGTNKKAADMTMRDRYRTGFATKCAQAGIDPDKLVRKAYLINKILSYAR